MSIFVKDCRDSEVLKLKQIFTAGMQKGRLMRELVDKKLMLEDVKSWVAMDSYEQHLINNMSAWIENLPTVEVSDEDCISRREAIEALDKRGDTYENISSL